VVAIGDTMTLDRRVLFPISMTGYEEVTGGVACSVASTTGRSLKLVFALYASIPVVVRNHQHMGCLLLPRGPVMTASIP